MLLQAQFPLFVFNSPGVGQGNSTPLYWRVLLRIYPKRILVRPRNKTNEYVQNTYALGPNLSAVIRLEYYGILPALVFRLKKPKASR